MKKISKSKTSMKKTTKKFIKKTKRRNPLSKIDLLNKYEGKQIIFIYQIPKDFEATKYETHRKTGILRSARWSKNSAWLVDFGKNRSFFIFNKPEYLERLDIKEMYPYPIFNFRGRPELDLPNKFDHLKKGL